MARRIGIQAASWTGGTVGAGRHQRTEVSTVEVARPGGSRCRLGDGGEDGQQGCGDGGYDCGTAGGSF
jgi:hypothetical protein